jgi:hypothetical protein
MHFAINLFKILRRVKSILLILKCWCWGYTLQKITRVSRGCNVKSPYDKLATSGWQGQFLSHTELIKQAPLLYYIFKALDYMKWLSGTPEATLDKLYNLIEKHYAGNNHRMLYSMAKAAELMGQKSKYCVLLDMFLKVCNHIYLEFRK